MFKSEFLEPNKRSCDWYYPEPRRLGISKPCSNSNYLKKYDLSLFAY